MKKFTFSSLLLAPLFAVLAACGGGGGDKSSTPSTPAVATLKSIAVAVPNATFPVGGSQTLVATGTFSDGSTKVLNTASGLVWTTKSGGAQVVQAFSTGIVTAKTVGTETINATQDSIVGSVTLTVNAPWTQVSAGGNQTIALKADGNLYAWGSNIAGQLGDGSGTDRNAPVVVSGGNTPTWKQVAVGDQFAVAIRNGTTTGTGAGGGTLWAWGNNQNGRLGDGTQVNKTAPVQIGKDSDWASVSVGLGHVLAIKTNGLLYAWGRNFNGQLGDGTTVGKLVPTKITIASAPTATWLAVSAGETHSLGIQKDGSLWAWGGNVYGQTGNGGTTDVTTGPVQIGTLSWTAVAAGSFHSVAIRADGTLYAWGQNSSGQVGNSGSANVSTPVQIDTVNNWNVISAGGLHSMGVRKDGTLWGWGSNAEGQLGDGGTDSPIPVQIGSRTNWTTISAGASHSFGMQSDNSLWGWGRNTEGQLGNGTKTTSPLPVNVPN